MVQDLITLTETHSIINQLALSDYHVHTGFGYCSPFLVPSEVVKLAKSIGFGKIAFTEHAAQLYVSEDDYWSGRFVDAPALLTHSRGTPLDRMKEYKKAMAKFRCKEVLLGLEVEVDCEGHLMLLEEDRNGWDILLGAVHFLPERYKIGSEEGFMWATERLIKSGINILAHPFRYFFRNQRLVPKELYKPVVKLLVEHNIAAELNFNGNENDPDFFNLCIENNVPIAIGSDTHDTDRIGNLNKHLNFMKQICPIDQLLKVLLI